jgi:hypothetical protein
LIRDTFSLKQQETRLASFLCAFVKRRERERREREKQLNFPRWGRKMYCIISKLSAVKYNAIKQNTATATAGNKCIMGSIVGGNNFVEAELIH